MDGREDKKGQDRKDIRRKQEGTEEQKIGLNNTHQHHCMHYEYDEELY